jgi:hypothetical protein
MMVEPKAHVSPERYKQIKEKALSAGLIPISELKIRFSRGALFKIA